MTWLMTALQRRLSLAPSLPTGGGALVMAELFYKFHSFTLECLAFLATWLVFDVAREGVMQVIHSADPSSSKVVP
jgi:hypothetical protein